MTGISKVETAAGYPPEEGCYLRGNDYSPVAVAVILRWKREEIPPDIENLVRVAVESGAALAGTLQTENIGLEKVICNIVSNPNIRYLVVCGPESPGHLVGDAILALCQNDVDANKRIVGAKAPTPYLFNIPLEFIDRFRKQIKVVDLINEGSPEILRQAVWACYQEEPTAFRDLMLHDPGAFSEPPLSGKITWRVTHPEREPKTKEEQTQKEHLKVLMERVSRAVQAKKQPPSPFDSKDEKLRVLFLCTGNSCCSRMAEGWARQLKNNVIEACSAGIEKHELDPRAVKVMAEAGVDISAHKSKTVADLPTDKFDYVITLCGQAQETSPVFPGQAKVIHRGFDDPPRLAEGVKDEQEKLAHYRRVRDEIRSFVAALPENLFGDENHRGNSDGS